MHRPLLSALYADAFLENKEMRINHSHNTPYASGSWSLMTALIIIVLASVAPLRAQEPDSVAVRKVLFVGDSMTGWMAERLNAYGELNGFEVATIVWDGSTIAKWASADSLDDMISQENPDAILVCLGMNEMFEPDPEKRFATPTQKLLETFGDTPLLWIGPPSWPGNDRGKTFDAWMARTLGDNRYFSSIGLDIPRQSKRNPHPSREGIEEWIDKVVEWIPDNSDIGLKDLERPESGKVSRGKTFIYKRMKDSL